MGAKIYEQRDYLIQPASPLGVMSEQYPPPRHKDGGQDRWQEIVPMVRTFTNAYVTQELDHLFGGPGDLSWAFDVFDSPEPIMLFLSLVIVARENFVGVEVEWMHPIHSSSSFIRIPPASRQKLFVRLHRSVGDCRVDFHMHLTGSSTRHSESDPRGYEDISIDRSLVVQCDAPTMHPRPNSSLEADIFLQTIGYPVFRFSFSEIRDDAFGCASRVFRHLAESEIVTDPIQEPNKM